MSDPARDDTTVPSNTARVHTANPHRGAHSDISQRQTRSQKSWQGWELSNGWGGIRTRETLSGPHAFQACALNRSATHPITHRRMRRGPASRPPSSASPDPQRAAPTDRVGFEPTIPGSPVCRFSRPVPSATRPPVLSLASRSRRSLAESRNITRKRELCQRSLHAAHERNPSTAHRTPSPPHRHEPPDDDSIADGAADLPRIRPSRLSHPRLQSTRDPPARAPAHPHTSRTVPASRTSCIRPSARIPAHVTQPGARGSPHGQSRPDRSRSGSPPPR